MALIDNLVEDFTSEMVDFLKKEESDMLRITKARLARGVTQDGWAEKKLKEVTAMKKQLIHAQRNTTSKIYRELEAQMNAIYTRGYHTGLPASYDDFLHGKTIRIPPSVRALILERAEALQRSQLLMLRSAQDGYKEVIGSVLDAVALGTKSKKQALQSALNKFADKGLTGFIDKANKHWDLATYTEMAIRTGSMNAHRQGSIDRNQDQGNDLMIVSSHGITCPFCAPYEGQVISISGNTPGYPSLDQAIADGLFHPNCKHVMTGYIPGLTVVKPQFADYKPDQYDVTQQQRANERQIRKWKKRSNVAITDDAKKLSGDKVRFYQKKQRDLLDDYKDKYGMTLKRKYNRESITGRKGRITPPKPPVKPPKVVKPKPIVQPKPKPKVRKKAPDWFEVDPQTGQTPRRAWIDSERDRINHNTKTIHKNREFRKFSQELQKRDGSIKTINKPAALRLDRNYVGDSGSPVLNRIDISLKKGDKSIIYRQEFLSDSREQITTARWDRAIKEEIFDQYGPRGIVDLEDAYDLIEDYQYVISNSFNDVKRGLTLTDNFQNRLDNIVEELERIKKFRLAPEYKRLLQKDPTFALDHLRSTDLLGEMDEYIQSLKNLKAFKIPKAEALEIVLPKQVGGVKETFKKVIYDQFDGSAKPRGLSKGKEAIDKVIDWYDTYAYREFEAMQNITINFSNTRGYALPNARKISVAASTSKEGLDTIAHEIGHVWHNNTTGNVRTIRRWFNDRIDGDKISTIYRGTSEVGFKDKFFDHYVGRIYGGDEKGEE